MKPNSEIKNNTGIKTKENFHSENISFFELYLCGLNIFNLYHELTVDKYRGVTALTILKNNFKKLEFTERIFDSTSPQQHQVIGQFYNKFIKRKSFKLKASKISRLVQSDSLLYLIQ